MQPSSPARVVSVVLVGLASVLALLTAWTVAATTGYPALERWVVGTWTGTDPHAAVFVGGALLVGLAATSAAANAGLLPSLLLSAGPLFGAAVTRYSTVVTTHVGERVVSLPDAMAFAFGVAAVGGVLVGAVGYGRRHRPPGRPDRPCGPAGADQPPK